MSCCRSSVLFPCRDPPMSPSAKAGAGKGAGPLPCMEQQGWLRAGAAAGKSRLLLTLNISRLAALRRSSMRELERGLEASLSERTMMSGDGVNRPLSCSLRAQSGGEERMQGGTGSQEERIREGRTPP